MGVTTGVDLAALLGVQGRPESAPALLQRYSRKFVEGFGYSRSKGCRTPVGDLGSKLAA